MKKKNFKFEIFQWNYPPTRHIKFERLDFAHCNRSIMANKLLSTNLERFQDGLNLRLRVNSAKYIAR